MGIVCNYGILADRVVPKKPAAKSVIWENASNWALRGQEALLAVEEEPLDQALQLQLYPALLNELFSVKLEMRSLSSQVLKLEKKVEAFMDEKKAVQANFVKKAEPVLNELFSLPENWDSYGGSKIKTTVREKLVQLLGRAFSVFSSMEKFLPFPSIVPIPNGMIQLEWDLPEKALEIEFLDTGSFSILLCLPEDKHEELRGDESVAISCLLRIFGDEKIEPGN